MKLVGVEPQILGHHTMLSWVDSFGTLTVLDQSQVFALT